MINDNTAIAVKDLKVSAGNQLLVNDISFSLKKGEMVSIIGASGSGKSTILRTINRLTDRETNLNVSGEIYLHGRSVFESYPLNELRRRIGLVFQKPCVFPCNIYKNVLFGVRHHRRLQKHDADNLVENVLRKAHLWPEVKDRLLKSAGELSIGQQQRLAFARTLAVDPDILMLDEPTSSLDPHSTAEIESSLLELKASKTILFVTHSLEQGKRISDKVIFISASSGCGRIVEAADKNKFFSNPELEETKQYLSTCAV